MPSSPKRVSWTAEADRNLVKTMKNLGYDEFYAKDQYSPNQDADWDKVAKSLNLSSHTRSFTFNKRQVKERWEQHLRPGITPRKALSRESESKILLLVEQALKNKEFLGDFHGQSVGWVRITQLLWESGVRCSTATVKNVWNAHMFREKKYSASLSVPCGASPSTSECKKLNTQGPIILSRNIFSEFSSSKPGLPYQTAPQVIDTRQRVISYSFDRRLKALDCLSSPDEFHPGYDSYSEPFHVATRAVQTSEDLRRQWEDHIRASRLSSLYMQNIGERKLGHYSYDWAPRNHLIPGRREATPGYFL
mmetsp:Transcript_26069/g.62014  ORF Transcript_26069/g.62014 Transcript_26069/m.62014 type:complete len:306 (-) Transcript_26069:139-1056(-)